MAQMIDAHSVSSLAYHPIARREISTHGANPVQPVADLVVVVFERAGEPDFPAFTESGGERPERSRVLAPSPADTVPPVTLEQGVFREGTGERVREATVITQ